MKITIWLVLSHIRMHLGNGTIWLQATLKLGQWGHSKTSTCIRWRWGSLLTDFTRQQELLWHQNISCQLSLAGTGRCNKAIWHYASKHTLNCSKKLCFLPHLQVRVICLSSITDSIWKSLFPPLLSARKRWHQESDKENILVPGLEEFVSEGESWWLVSNFASFHPSATHTGLQAVALRSRGNSGYLQGIREGKPVFRRLLLTT